jgi:hypothetical protein
VLHLPHLPHVPHVPLFRFPASLQLVVINVLFLEDCRASRVEALISLCNENLPEVNLLLLKYLAAFLKR